MGEKDDSKNDAEKKAVAPEDGEKKVTENDGKKEEEPPITVVLKLDLHCEGCAKKVRRSICNFEGVEKVKADCTANKLTVTGNVDPVWLRERVESKTKKKVALVSPQPKKDGDAAGDKKPDEKSEKKADEKKDDDKKPKEPVVNTVVMKIRLHCDGCAHKIKRVILKNIDGVDSVSTDLEKDLVTVIGTMDVKELIAYLKEKVKRSIEIVPPKKDDGGGDKKPKEGEEKKEKEGSGDGDKKGKEKEKEKENEKKEDNSKAVATEGTKVEVNKMEYHGYNPQTYYAMTMYNQSYGSHGHDLPMYHHQDYSSSSTGYAVQQYYSQGPPPPPPTYLNNIDDQMFSDENPNGCYVM